MSSSVRSVSISYYNEEVSDVVVPYLAYHLTFDTREDIRNFALMSESIELESERSSENNNIVYLNIKCNVRVLHGMFTKLESMPALELGAECLATDYDEFCQRMVDCGYWTFLLLLNEDHEACRITVNPDGAVRTQEIVWPSEVPYAFPAMIQNKAGSSHVEEEKKVVP